MGVGHFEERGHTTIGRSSTFAIDVGLMGESRFPKMYVVVYHTRQNDTPRGIYSFIVAVTGDVVSFDHVGDTTIFNDDRPLKSSALVYNRTAENQRFHCLSGLAKSFGVGAGAALTDVAGAVVPVCVGKGTSFIPFIIC